MGILSNFRFSFNNIFFTPLLYGVVASLAVFIATWDKGDRIKDKFHDKFRRNQDTFDFIIVGGGSAGSVVAYRLSEYYSVLLLEAGGEPHIFQSIPIFSLFMPNYPEIDWMHKTVRQRRSCFACPHGQSSWSQGKNLGGSGNLNSLIHLRGNPKDFDNWAKITGDPSWGYEGVLPFFKRSEDFMGGSTDENAHGTGGPLGIELPDYQGMAQEFLWAGRELGYPNVDLNGRFEEGCDAIYYPIRRGVRQATYKAFIQPARKRRTLTIRKFAHVNKVILRSNDLGAYAVEYDRHGKRVVAYANKEVILSAGTVQTPKILMLSGIGPWKHLNDVGFPFDENDMNSLSTGFPVGPPNFKIPVRLDLPVGNNLQDHLSTFVGPFFIDKPKSLQLDRDVTPKSFLKWGIHGKGVLTTSGFQAAAIVTSYLAKSKGQQDWPDIQLLLQGLSIHKTFASDFAHAHGIREDILSQYIHHDHGKESFMIVASNGRPVSRGEVRLGGRDPYDKLLIDPKYLEDIWDHDIKVMIEAVKKSVAFVENSTSFQNLGGQLTNKPFPGCEHHWLGSDQYWECYIRQFSVTLNNPVGTCAMGQKDSPHAVVDAELRVIGSQALRVIDASVMPCIVVSETQAATIMIAEKGADMILRYWQGQADDSEKHKHYSGFANSNRAINPSSSKIPHDPFANPFSLPMSEFPDLGINSHLANLFSSFTQGQNPTSSPAIANPFQNLFSSFQKHLSVSSSSQTQSSSTQNPLEKILSAFHPTSPAPDHDSNHDMKNAQDSMFPRKHSNESESEHDSHSTTHNTTPTSVSNTFNDLVHFGSENQERNFRQSVSPLNKIRARNSTSSFNARNNKQKNGYKPQSATDSTITTKEPSVVIQKADLIDMMGYNDEIPYNYNYDSNNNNRYNSNLGSKSTSQIIDYPYYTVPQEQLPQSNSNPMTMNKFKRRRNEKHIPVYDSRNNIAEIITNDKKFNSPPPPAPSPRPNVFLPSNNKFSQNQSPRNPNSNVELNNFPHDLNEPHLLPNLPFENFESQKLHIGNQNPQHIIRMHGHAQSPPKVYNSPRDSRSNIQFSSAPVRHKSNPYAFNTPQLSQLESNNVGFVNSYHQSHSYSQVPQIRPHVQYMLPIPITDNMSLGTRYYK